MFLLGSPVRVKYSSKSEGMGPRVGTEAFTATFPARVTFLELPPPRTVPYCLAYASYKLICYKYGNEKKERVEQKVFSSIIPICTDKLSELEYRTIAEDFITRMKNGNIVNDKKIKQAITKTTGGEFGFLEPIKTPHKMSDIQTSAFLKTIKHNTGLLAIFIANNAVYFEKTGLGSRELVLSLFSTSKEGWHNVLSQKKTRDDAVLIGRGILSVFNCQEMRKNINFEDESVSLPSLEQLPYIILKGTTVHPEFIEERRKFYKRFVLTPMLGPVGIIFISASLSIQKFMNEKGV